MFQRPIWTKSLPTIETGAFRMPFAEATLLESINLDSVKRIDADAFSRCSHLTNITLSSELVSIGAYAFYRVGTKTIHYNGDESQWRNAEFKANRDPNCAKWDDEEYLTSLELVDHTILDLTGPDNR